MSRFQVWLLQIVARLLSGKHDIELSSSTAQIGAGGMFCDCGGWVQASTSSPEVQRQGQRSRSRSYSMPQRMQRKSGKAWRQLLGNRNFRAIALINAVMFATANGSRSVLMPLLAVQGYKMKTTFLGKRRPEHNIAAPQSMESPYGLVTRPPLNSCGSPRHS